MEKCECYKTRTINMTGLKDCAGYKIPWHETYTEGYCLGTKECELCQCNGDKSKCDFYDYIRKEASKMNTLEMMNEAEKTGRTYTSGEIGSSDMMYNAEQGFHDIYGKPWDGYAFKYLNDLFASDIEWQVIPENTMTKSEAEAKFNIKIVG